MAWIGAFGSLVFLMLLALSVYGSGGSPAACRDKGGVPTYGLGLKAVCLKPEALLDVSN